MTDSENTNPTHTPDFIREREAWYKAGASATTMYICIAVLVVGILVGLASLIFGLGPYEAATGIIAGTWCSSAMINFYIDVSARKIVSRGNVQVDRF